MLDTWFSSGLWPFSTLGWPEDTPELNTYYPTSVLVTGYDILFFWVARMAMLGLRLTKAPPFRDVYIHTLIRDAEGQKMSKSKGNVVDPLEVMERFGTDAFRFTLATIAAPTVRDVRISDDRVESYRNFANKLWNAARLVLSNLDGYAPGRKRRGTQPLPDRWIKSRLAATIRSVRTHLDRYRFNDAASTLYQFVWNDFCDWYLEMAKIPLYRAGDGAARRQAQETLVTVLETTLRLLHPFMPFITEEIWQRLPEHGESIMLAPYPNVGRGHADAAAERDMTVVMDAVTAIRNIRGEMRISPATTLDAIVRPSPEHAAVLATAAALVETLARTRLTVDPAASRPAGSALAVVRGSELYVSLEGVVDVAAERARLDKEIRKAAETVGFIEGKLARPEFVERAPAEIVEKERQRLAEQRELREKLEASLAWISR